MHQDAVLTETLQQFQSVIKPPVGEPLNVTQISSTRTEVREGFFVTNLFGFPCGMAMFGFQIAIVIHVLCLAGSDLTKLYIPDQYLLPLAILDALMLTRVAPALAVCIIVIGLIYTHGRINSWLLMLRTQFVASVETMVAMGIIYILPIYAISAIGQEIGKEVFMAISALLIGILLNYHLGVIRDFIIEERTVWRVKVPTVAVTAIRSRNDLSHD